LLAIGYGQGQGKALKAVEHALHHPLIESINIEHATAIIANFTAGQDLSFIEVAEALTFLQEKTNHQAEIIPGAIANENMGDKVQVILVITGLGATPVDTRTQPAKVDNSVLGATPAQHPQPVPAQVQMVSTSHVDLDVPAFIRRRLR
jgi:cell division protein FtsZ